MKKATELHADNHHFLGKKGFARLGLVKYNLLIIYSSNINQACEFNGKQHFSPRYYKI